MSKKITRRGFVAALLGTTASALAPIPGQALGVFPGRVQRPDLLPPQVLSVQSGAGWSGRASSTTYAARAGKGFQADPLPADPSYAIQQQPGFSANFLRVVANWSDPDGAIVTKEDCPGGKFRMGIEAYHRTGIHHIDVFVEGASGASKITIPGSALTNLVRTDPVTGKVWTNANHYVFDMALPDSLLNQAGGLLQYAADLYPNAGFPVRLGKNGPNTFGAGAFTPQSMFFDPFDAVPWELYYLAPASGSPTSGVKGDNTANSGRSAASPWATFTRFRNSAPANKPTKLFVYDGSYLEDSPLYGFNDNPVSLWVRFQETPRGAVFGRLTFSLTDPAPVNALTFRTNVRLWWDGVTFNTANLYSYLTSGYTSTFRRSLLQADWGSKADGTNRNGPGQPFTINGPAVDEQYGIYWPLGYGHSTTGLDKPVNNDALFGNVSFLECEIHQEYGMGSGFMRNNLIDINRDVSDIATNIRLFGNIATTGRNLVPGIDRITKEQVVYVDQCTYDPSTKLTTMNFQNNASGAPISMGFPSNTPNVQACEVWALDVNSKYYYTTMGIGAGYGSHTGTFYRAYSGGPARLYVTFQGDLTDGFASGSPILCGGYAHNDWMQAQGGNPSYSTPADTLSKISDNYMLTHNTLLGRPSSMWTMSTGDLRANPTTRLYNGDGSVNTTTPAVASYFEVQADGRTSRTTDAAGNDLPVIWMCRNYGITLGALPSGAYGSRSTILIYNATSQPITDPVFGTFAPGHGLMSSPLLDGNRSPRAYNQVVNGVSAGAYYVGMVGNSGMAVVNNLFVPSSNAYYGIGWSFVAIERWIFVGNTFFGGGSSNGSEAAAAEGFYAADNYLRTFYSETNGDYKDFVSNSLGGSGHSGDNVVEATVAMPDQAAWADPQVPPLPINLTKRASTTNVRKFDRYGSPIVPGVSFVGARAA